MRSDLSSSSKLQNQKGILHNHDYAMLTPDENETGVKVTTKRLTNSCMWGFHVAEYGNWPFFMAENGNVVYILTDFGRKNSGRNGIVIFEGRKK